jgi:uncharacterized membrane protein YbhN (UPF0104 family)
VQAPVREESPTRLERAGELASRAGSLQPSDPSLRRGLHAGIAIVVVLGVGLAVFAAIGDFPSVDLRLRPFGILLALVSMTIYLIGSGEVWRRVLHALGPELGPLRAQSIWFASGLGRYVPAALLLPMLRMAMCDREGVRKGVCMASIAYELALFFTASLLVGAYFVITLPDLEGVWQRYLVLVLPAVALIALQPRIFHTLADRSLVRLGRAPLPRSLPSRRVAEFVALYAGAEVFAGLAVYGLAQCVYPVGTDDMPTVIGSYAVANTLSVLAFVIPGGLGAREAAMAAALSPVMPAEPALAIAVLSRVLQVAMEVLFALLMPVLARRPTATSRASWSSRRQPAPPT